MTVLAGSTPARAGDPARAAGGRRLRGHTAVVHGLHSGAGTALVEAAAAVEAELVVNRPPPAHPVGKLVMGSTAQDVLLAADCPCWPSRAPEPDQGRGWPSVPATRADRGRDLIVDNETPTMLLRRRRAPEGDPTVPRERLPAVNAHVDVFTGTGAPRPSRVEDSARGVVVVSWPTDAGGYRLEGRPGDAVTLSWTSQQGVHELAGTIAEARSEPVPLWSVRALAAPPVNQRREAFRLDVRLPLELRVPAAAAGTAVEASTVDLSESGLRFVVAAAAALELGTAVEATLRLDDGDITLPATVVRLGEPRDGERSGGMRFDGVTEDAATRLRRYVLNEQIRRRSLVRD